MLALTHANTACLPACLPTYVQLLSCKSLGMLRRIMIKHKATMEPEHVADTLLCLQHLVRVARTARRAGTRGGAAALGFMHHATSQARSQPRVRAAGELYRSRVSRASESDGHMEQLMAQMLGELGNMIWFMVSCQWGVYWGRGKRRHKRGSQLNCCVAPHTKCEALSLAFQEQPKDIISCRC